MSLPSGQLTELVDIREQFVSRFVDKHIGQMDNPAEITGTQVVRWSDEGYREFRRLYPLLNDEFAPHLPEHFDILTETSKDSTVGDGDMLAIKEAQGWTDASLFNLSLTFISRNHHPEFLQFLEDVAREENEAGHMP